MKLALVLGTSTGGTGRHVRMLAAGCAARGVATEVLGPAQTDRDFGFSALPGVGFTAADIADRPRLRGDLVAIGRLRRLLRAWRPDVVHAHGLRAGALAVIAAAFVRSGRYEARPGRYEARPGRYEARAGRAGPGRPSRAGPGRPALVVTVHNAPPTGGVTSAIYRVLELIVARRADSVLCVSPDLQQRMRAAGARQVRPAVVPTLSAPYTPPVPSVPSDSSAPAAPARPLVLAVGRLAPQKGFGLLLQAAGRWRDVKPEPVLMVVGQGPLEAELKSMAAALGLDVRFPGQREDVPALLAAAAVFVLPSVWEGQPLVLQEALRAGVPIVATRVGGIPAVTGEDAALLVPSGDLGRLADAVRAVLTDPALAARLSRAARDRARALPTEADAVTAAMAEYTRVTVSP